MVTLGYGWLVRRRVKRVRAQVEARWEEACWLAGAREELVTEVTEELQDALYATYRLAHRLVEQGIMGPEEAARQTAGLIGRSEELTHRTENLLAAGRSGPGTWSWPARSSTSSRSSGWSWADGTPPGRWR